MDTKLTLKQFEELNKNLIVDEAGNTNKHCPICGESVVIEVNGNSYAIKCSKKDCFSLDCRGI